MDLYKRKTEFVAAGVWKGNFPNEFGLVRNTVFENLICRKCGYFLGEHAVLDKDGGGMLVCPGNYLVRDEKENWMVYEEDEFMEEYDFINVYDEFEEGVIY